MCRFILIHSYLRLRNPVLLQGGGGKGPFNIRGNDYTPIIHSHRASTAYTAAETRFCSTNIVAAERNGALTLAKDKRHCRLTIILTTIITIIK